MFRFPLLAPMVVFVALTIGDAAERSPNVVIFLADDLGYGPQIGARRSAAGPPDAPREDASGGDARGVRHRTGTIDQFGDEGGLAAGAPDTLDQGGWPGNGADSTVGEVAVEHRGLRVGEAEPGR